MVTTKSLLANARLDEKYGLPLEHIETTMGITHVRHCDESVKPSDLARPAAEKALAKCGMDARDLDMVLFCGIERDGTEPATAQIVAGQIGIDPSRLKYCWDLGNACHGFTAGIITAMSFIRSGQIKTALICTGERSSSKTKVITDDFLSGHLSKKDIGDTMGAFTVSDAGGAMILTASDDDTGIEHIGSENYSRFTDLCYFMNFGLDRGVKPTYAMKMPQICARTLKVVKKSVPAGLAKLGWKAEDIDHFVCHQVGKRIFDAWIEIVGVTKDKALMSYPMRGNLASASLPVLWDDLTEQGKLKPGQKVYAISTGSPVIVTQLGITL